MNTFLPEQGLRIREMMKVKCDVLLSNLISLDGLVMFAELKKSANKRFLESGPRQENKGGKTTDELKECNRKVIKVLQIKLSQCFFLNRERIEKTSKQFFFSGGET